MSDENTDKKAGRPRIYASAAERQRAYRQRLKQDGKRVISKIVLDVRDTSKPLTSSIIDLSEVKGAKGIE